MEKKKVSDEAISEGVRLMTSDLLDAKDGNKVVGFVYEVDVKGDRFATFHIDVSGSENLALSDGKSMSKVDVESGAQKCEVARVLVKDMTKPWSLQCRYTWTEKTRTVKEIAQDIMLETVEYWTKGRAITAIEYNLRVNMNKRVVFTIDFEGSQNLELATGGKRLRTTVEPFATSLVGFLQVVNPALPWSLKCKYEWSEETTGKPVLGIPERKDLADGLVLVTTRLDGDEFHYKLAVSKNVVVDFTLDCSESTNMMIKGGEMKKQTVIQPWDRADVGVIVPVNPVKPWSLKVKFSWSERSRRPPASSTGSDASASFQPSSAVGNIVEKVSHLDISEGSASSNAASGSLLVERESTSTLDDSEEQQVHHPSSAAAPVPKRKAPGLTLDLGEDSNAHDASAQKSPQRSPNPDVEGDEKVLIRKLSVPIPVTPPPTTAESTMDQKEISPEVFLTTTQTPGKIVYKLEVKKPSTVKFVVNFEGSSNLVLFEHDENTPLIKTCVVEPFHHPQVVAKLFVNDDTLPWTLRCKYHFEEQDALITSVRTSPTNHGKTTAQGDKLLSFLQEMAMDQFYDTFKKEQVDWDLLLEIGKNEDSLRSTLKDLGITTIGQREKVITTLRKYQK